MGTTAKGTEVQANRLGAPKAPSSQDRADAQAAGSSPSADPPRGTQRGQDRTLRTASFLKYTQTMQKVIANSFYKFSRFLKYAHRLPV